LYHSYQVQLSDRKVNENSLLQKKINTKTDHYRHLIWILGKVCSNWSVMNQEILIMVWLRFSILLKKLNHRYKRVTFWLCVQNITAWSHKTITLLLFIRIGTWKKQSLNQQLSL